MRDPVLLQEWQLKLQRMYKINGWWKEEALRMAMPILPYLNSEAIDQWLVYIRKKMLKPTSGVFSKQFIACIDQLFSTFSTEKQVEYGALINEIVYSGKFHLGGGSVLKALPNLLRQMPDEMIEELTDVARTRSVCTGSSV
jgi:hypothetical protein